MRPFWLPLVVCLLPWTGAPQEPFRVDVKLVNVGFAVIDHSGKYVPDLTAQDIEVTEDGVPQKLAFFARSPELPLSLGLIVDMSGSQSSFIGEHEKDLKVFLDTVLTQRDSAFMVCFGNPIRLVVDHTANVKLLAEAAGGYRDVHNKAVYPELGPPDFRMGGTAFYDAIYYPIQRMFQKVERGRKALIIFSDGEDNSSAHNMMETIELAQSENVLLFPVRYTETRDGRLTARNKYGTSVMARMAKETGGADFNAQERGLAAHFKQIGDQLRMSYELGYYSSAPLSDGTFRKIKIRTKREDLTVRAKTGYYAK